MRNYGTKVWLIPDGFISTKSNGQDSHDAVCILNTTDTDAEICLTLYFEDTDLISDFKSYCKAGKTHHIRMDKLKGESGMEVPRDTPYAILVESDVNIVAQYSRLDTSQSEMALMTTIAYPVE